jgi:hypothetical protein
MLQAMVCADTAQSRGLKQASVTDAIYRAPVERPRKPPLATRKQPVSGPQS